MKKTLFVSLILLLLPLMASADDKGKCGKEVTYHFSTAMGTLTIEGKGAMSDFKYKPKELKHRIDVRSDAPWGKYHDEIKSVVIKEGVTSIGEYAFYYCDNLVSVTIPNSVTSIGSCAFWNCHKYHPQQRYLHRRFCF